MVSGSGYVGICHRYRGLFFFFFSSRRRHTRCSRDWSSDVCSSDLPGIPVVGGLASGDLRLRRTHVFLDEQVYDQGAVALALGGPYEIRTIVSQGCTPIGEPWTITGAAGNVIEMIARRPAYQVLRDTIDALPADVR